MTYPYEYSAAEIKLIEVLNMQDIAMSNSMIPPMLYYSMAIECFRHNMNNEVSTSVRNCLLKLENPSHGILRLTKEFDSLILV
jgi:hypothetical protein